MPYPTEGRAAWSGDQIAIFVDYKQRLTALAALPVRYPRDTPDRVLHTNGWHRVTPWRNGVADLERWAP